MVCWISNTNPAVHQVNSASTSRDRVEVFLALRSFQDRDSDDLWSGDMWMYDMRCGLGMAQRTVFQHGIENSLKMIGPVAPLVNLSHSHLGIRINCKTATS